MLAGPAFAQTPANQQFHEDPAFERTKVILDNAVFDSLSRLISGAPDDTMKVIRLTAISNYDPNNKIALLNQAKKLAGQLHFYQGLAGVDIISGAYYQDQDDFSTALAFYRQAIIIDETHGFVQRIFEDYPAALNLYFYSGNFPAAMELTTKGLSLAEKTGNIPMQAKYNGLCGFIYLSEGNFTESKKYYTRYYNICMQLRDTINIADACNCMGDACTVLQDYNNAFAWFFKALHIYANLEDFKRFNTGAAHMQKVCLANTFYKISQLYKLTGNYKTALYYSDSVFNYASLSGFNKYDLAAYYINGGAIYKQLKNYGEALVMLNNGLLLAKQIQHKENIRDACDALAETYAALHKYDSAFFFARLYTQLKDSIVNDEGRMKIAQIQSQYDNERKDTEIARKELLRNVLIVGFVVLLTILFLLYSRYLLKQKNKFQAQVNKQQTDLFIAVVSAQDKERKRIAQDIHDSLGSVLSAAKLSISDLEGDKNLLTKSRKEKYETALALLDDASAELRNISHNLMPATLLKLGLVAALQNLFDRISATGVHISFTTHDARERLAEAMEISVYRIVLELVNNIVKHAKATEVTAQLIKYPLYINITIEDNGIGFNYMQTAADTKGMGLSNVLSRIEYLKGTMDIDSGKGTGTTVIIDIPLDTNNMV